MSNYKFIASSAAAVLARAPAVADRFAGVLPLSLEARLGAQLRPRSVPLGAIITLAGDQSPPLIALLAGSVSLTSGAGAVDCGPIDIIAGPAWVATANIPTLLPTSEGLMPLASGVNSAVATVTARKSVIVATIGPAQLDRLRGSDPELHMVLVHSARALLARLMLALFDSLLPSGERRCAAALLRLAAGRTHIPVTQAELALLAGVSRHAVSRALRDFEEKGILSQGYGSIELLDRDRLMRLRAAEDRKE